MAKLSKLQVREKRFQMQLQTLTKRLTQVGAEMDKLVKLSSFKRIRKPETDIALTLPYYTHQNYLHEYRIGTRRSKKVKLKCQNYWLSYWVFVSVAGVLYAKTNTHLFNRFVRFDRNGERTMLPCQSAEGKCDTLSSHGDLIVPSY